MCLYIRMWFQNNLSISHKQSYIFESIKKIIKAILHSRCFCFHPLNYDNYRVTQKQLPIETIKSGTCTVQLDLPISHQLPDTFTKYSKLILVLTKTSRKLLLMIKIIFNLFVCFLNRWRTLINFLYWLLFRKLCNLY